MREISAALITKSVARMCIEANCYLPEDVRARLEGSLRDEPWPIAQEILTHILQNAEMAAARPQPICQDTGMACVFVELGQDVHVDGDLAEAIHEGVRRGYTDGYLRKSVVRDPLDRVNTGDNTPAMIYYEIVPGDQLKITIAPKGFGSENMSRIQMLRPSDGVEGVKKFVLDAVEQAGANPCPPIVQRRRCCARPARTTKTKCMPRLRTSFWKRSTPSASARRASADGRRRLPCTSSPCRRTSRGCRSRSTSTATWQDI